MLSFLFVILEYELKQTIFNAIKMKIVQIINPKVLTFGFKRYIVLIGGGQYEKIICAEQTAFNQ